MQRARLILICGLPGSGKTTLAKRLATEVRAVRLCPDEWKHALGIDYYDEAARVRLEARLWQLAQELLALGQNVIMENGFWAREERDELRLAGRRLGVTVEMHYLDAPVEELWRRLQVRNSAVAAGAVPITRSDLEMCGRNSSRRRTPTSSLFSTPFRALGASGYTARASTSVWPPAPSATNLLHWGSRSAARNHSR